MNRICQCCGSSVPENQNVCPRCRLLYVVALDHSGECEIVAAAGAHRTALLSKLTNFSVISHRYKWNDTSWSLEANGSDEIKIADGSDCDGHVFWSKENFGQHPTDRQTPLSLEISYRIKGRTIKETVVVSPVCTEDFWHVGMKIDEQFRLTVYLGNQTNHSSSTPVQLELH